jgi:hypothetical protein
MRTSDGMQVAYNAQIAVDDKNKIIVSLDITNEGNDQNQLSPLAIDAKNTLKVDKLEIVADMGYYNTLQIKECLDQQIIPNLPEPPKCNKSVKDGVYSKTDFRYDKEKDIYVCPQGKQLHRRTWKVNRDNKEYIIYAAKSCKDCPSKSQCTSGKKSRRVQRSVYEELLDDMRLRVERNRDLMEKRKALVEHPFGTIKRSFDQGYFLSRGLLKVKAEFSLSALVYNMKRAMNVVGVKTMIQALG